MRIAVFIISILVIIIMLLQSCVVFGLGSVSDSLGGEEEPSDVTAGGAVGMGAALVAFIGMAFVLKIPTVALIAYVIGALLAFLAGSSGFGDMNIWGVVLLVLAGMAFWARRETRRGQPPEG